MKNRKKWFHLSLVLNLLLALLVGTLVFQYRSNQAVARHHLTVVEEKKPVRSSEIENTATVVSSKNKTYQTRRSVFYSLESPKEKHQIVFLGDSITQNNNWNEMFANPNILNRGISGDTTNGILHRISNIVYLQPRKLFIMAGINDFTVGRTVSKVTQNYIKIIRIIRKASPATTIYVQSTLPVNNALNGSLTSPEKILMLNHNLRNYCAQTGIRFINLYPFFADASNHLRVGYTYDGTHPNGKAYLVWRAYISKYVH
ncbi:GDSL-type esterase/lipase family protein [Sporolactobacillus vineae]|uniref:GDSL-type esterase/lipase family protein n=1 Tax=Sporolactobacillus vineae TaxID=444463 RepID=UPI000289378B|nr:GDSL-type esterase/lipase family protein [Sporolactobacillus vineae]